MNIKLLLAGCMFGAMLQATKRDYDVWVLKRQVAKLSSQLGHVKNDLGNHKRCLGMILADVHRLQIRNFHLELQVNPEARAELARRGISMLREFIRF